MARNIVAGIDCGSQAIKITIMEDRGVRLPPRIISLAKTASAGIKQGYVYDIDLVIESLHKALQMAEKNIDSKIKRAFVGFGGIGLSSNMVEHSISVSRGDNEITDLDIKRLVDEAEDKIPNSINLEVLAKINLSFDLDEEKVLGDPRGYKGEKLSGKMLFLTGVRQHIRDLKTSVEKTGIYVEDIVPFPLATQTVTISPKQKEYGCVIIDIGSDTTSISIFDDGILESVSVIPIGSMKVTEDIAIGLRVDIEEAEEIKKGPKFQGAQEEKKLKNIVESRLSEIFKFVKEHLKKTQKEFLPAGVILTGGGANILGIKEISEEVLGLPSKLTNPLYPKNFSMDENSHLEKLVVDEMDYSSSYGLSIYGLNPEHSDESLGIKIGKGTRGSIIKAIKQFLP